MQPQQLGAAVRHQLHSASQFVEGEPHVQHQRLTLGAEPNNPSIPLKKVGSQRLLKLQD